MKRITIVLTALITGALFNTCVFLRAQEAQEEAQTREAAGGAAPETDIGINNSVMEIKPLETDSQRYSFELRDADLGDLFRVLAHDYKLNLFIDKDVQGKITVSLSNVTLAEALDTIAESQNLILEKKGSIIKVKPNIITKVFVLKYIEAKKILETSSGQSGIDTVSAGTDTNTVTGSLKSNTIYDLISEKGRILLGVQPNSIIIMDYPPNINRIGEYIEAIDNKMTSRVFKLKYLKATDVVGSISSASGTSETTAAASDLTNTTGTGSSSSSGTSYTGGS